MKSDALWSGETLRIMRNSKDLLSKTIVTQQSTACHTNMQNIEPMLTDHFDKYTLSTAC